MNRITLFFIALVISSTSFFFSTNFFNIWPLLWVATTPLLLYALSFDYKSSIALSVLAFFIGEFSVYQYFSIPISLPSMLIPMFIEAIIFSLIIVGTKFIFEKIGQWWVLFFPPLVMTALEFFISLISPNGTGDSLAYSQIDFTKFIQVSSITGIYGITFLLFLFSSGVAFLIHFLFKKKKQQALFSFLIVFIFEGLNILYGTIKINNYNPKKSIHVAIIASDKLTQMGHNKEKTNIVLNSYIEEIKKIVNKDINYVLLPEKIAVVTKEDETKFSDLFSNVAKQYNIYIIVGIRRTRSFQVNYNSAWIFSPKGEFMGTYDKHHLVPGIETAIPEGGHFPNIIPGDKFFSWSHSGDIFSAAICKDMDFQDMATHYGKENTKIMFVPTFDFVFDGWVHGRMAIMRAIEGGFSLVRAPMEGFLSVSDPFGRIISQKTTSSDEDFTTLISGVPYGTGETFFARFGNWFSWLCAALALVMLIFGVVKKKSEFV